LTALASRALIFFLIVVGSQIAFLGKDYGNTIWRTQVDLSMERLRPELTRMVMTGDAWYYRQIAADGYEPANGGPRNTWAFFPLYPLVAGLIPGDYAIAAMLVSNLSFVIAMLLVAAAGLRLGSTEEEVERAVFFMAFFPTSYFFSMPMTESLFLCVSAVSFYFAAKGKWWAAGLFGAAAAATRLVGVLLLPALLFLPSKDRKQKAWLLLIPTATLGFMLYMQRHTGDALAFVHAQTLWNRGTWDWSLMASKPWNFVLLNAAAAIFLAIAAVDLARKKQWAFAIYVAAAVAIPLSTGSVQSVARYALTVFPAFLWLAAKTSSRPLERLVSATFLILLGWLIAMFVLRVDFALA
ncbi:MAG TPA: hypothetical protein VEU30_08445, partial [Thermoanaerobaculia bacterium]|nr:hypothetical protein [Thermoanaerobaculia bacterium]